MNSARVAILSILAVFGFTGPAGALDSSEFALGPPHLVTQGGVEITVLGYSVPTSADWNADGLVDLIVGEGGGGHPGKVRVYPNLGNNNVPAFDWYFYAQSGGNDLELPAIGCLGAFPRMTDWDGDGKPDLLMGLADGTIKIFFNIGAMDEPSFDLGQLLQVGPMGSKVDIDVGSRATPVAVDWNNDGRKDLVVGAYDGLVRLYLNTGSDAAPDFLTEELVMASGEPLILDTLRTSPAIGDVSLDHNKDLILGDTEGRLLLFENSGSDGDPVFGDGTPITTEGIPIDLDSTRSRPALCDWDDDGLADVLLGSSDGTVRLYSNARRIFPDGLESGDTSLWSVVSP